MARRVAINFKEVKPIIVGPAGAFVASRIQRFEMPVTLPNTDVDELGHRVHVGQITDIPEVTVTFQAMDVSTKLFAALAGKVWANWTVNTAFDVSTLGEVDVIGEIKDSTTEDLAKAVVVRKAKVSNFTYSYSVDGEATEEYTVVGTDKRWFKYDVQVDTFTGATPLFAYTLTQTPIALKNTNKLVSVIANGVYLDEVTAAPATGEYRVTAGTTLTLGDAIAASANVVAVYHCNKALNWSDVSDQSIPVAIRGKNIPVYLKAGLVDRVQSVTLRGTFPQTAVKEMGNVEIVGYITSPTQVEGDLTILDTDLEMLALFTTASTNPADVEFRACEMTPSGISLEVRLYDPSLSCNLPVASGTVMKTLYVPSMTITSEGHSTSVGGNATQTFGWKSSTGELHVFKGRRV